MQRDKAVKARIFAAGEEQTRAADSLSVPPLPTMVVVKRMVREHLLPMKGYLALSLTAMVVVAMTTGLLPFLMQMTSDEIVVAKNLSSLYLLPPLVALVIGSMYLGFATATEAASFGVIGALALAAAQGSLNFATFRESLLGATRTSAMIALILMGAAFLSRCWYCP